MRKKGLPSGRRVHDPLLLFIYFHGGEDYQIHADDSYEPLADLFGLSPQERKMTRHDRNPDDYRTESDWHNRLQFARRDLVNYGYLDNTVKRGIWKLSKSGISYAQRIINNDQDLSNRVRSLVQNPSNISDKIESPNIKSQIAQIIKSEEKELTESKLFDVENLIDSRE
jgi:restriction endonuclease Mrr